MKEVLIKDIMTTDIASVSVNGIVSEAMDIFAQYNIHHLPVIDEDNTLVGIVSLTDIDRLKSGASLFKKAKKEKLDEVIFQVTWIRQIMTEDVIVLGPDESINKAYQIFKENKIRALPIMNGKKLVGMVTPIDLLNYFFK